MAELSTNANFIKKIYKYTYIFSKCIRIIEIKIIVRFVSKENITYINFKFRKKNSHTNVISFPCFTTRKNIEKDYIYIGDIVICPFILNIEHGLSKLCVLNYWKKVISHSILHLLKFDHKNYYEFKKMDNIEKKIYLKLRKI